MTVPLSLAVGEHVVLADPAIHWDAAVADMNPPRVVLTATFQIESNSGTTLAIQMDGRIALQLYGKLYELVRSMGWLPEE